MNQAVEQTTVESALNDAVAEFRRTDAVIAAVRDEYMSYFVAGVDDEEGYKRCKSARMDCVKMRTAAEKKKDELKKPVLQFGRTVDAELRRIKRLIEPIETHLKSQEAIVDDEKKRIEAEKAAAEKAKIDSRIAALAEYGESMPVDELKSMPDWKFESRLSNAKAAKAERDRLQAEENECRRIEDERLAKERAALDAERAELERQRKEMESKLAKEEMVPDVPAVESVESVECDKESVRQKIVAITWKIYDIIDKDLPDFDGREDAVNILNGAAKNLIALVED